ncbi:MAG: NAD(P)-dependent oxidoreductase [Cytophagales bacterium]|nr:NAD(P)-dependent oxidoreductase [Cytophagales bacterium]MDW8384875.1 NAD(P)-dependent oxidoreductase [Flammeovirgaceae bacterium]
MKILLTGGTGFLGSHLAQKLIESYELAILKRSHSSLKRLKNLDYLCFDIDKTSLEDIFKTFGPDIIIHTAASYGKNETASQTIATNLIFPLELLEKAIQFRVKTFINTDTSLPIFTNSYALSKKQFSQWLFFYSEKIQVVNMIVEYFYGAGDEEWKFITMLIRKMLRNEHIDLSECLAERDFIYIDDAVEGYLCVLKHLSECANFQNIELGSGQAIQLKRLALLCKSMINNTKSDLNFGKLPTRPNEVMLSKADTSFLTKLGWKPRYSLEEGILQTIKLESELL